MSLPVALEEKPARESEFFLPYRPLAVLAICLPTITAYACTISAYFTHSEDIANYTIGYCNCTKSKIMPISYSIATYNPQRQLWMLALFIHLPARFFIMMMIPRAWPKYIWRMSFHSATTLEILVLVCLSLFHMEHIVAYYVHAICFVLWCAATLCAAVLILHVQRVGGCFVENATFYRFWIAKFWITCAIVLVFCTIVIAYPLSQKLCSPAAFAIFCLGEYALIAFNAAFWTIVFVEFESDFQCFKVVTAMKKERKHNKVAPTTFEATEKAPDHSTL